MLCWVCWVWTAHFYWYYIQITNCAAEMLILATQTLQVVTRAMKIQRSWTKEQYRFKMQERKKERKKEKKELKLHSKTSKWPPQPPNLLVFWHWPWRPSTQRALWKIRISASFHRASKGPTTKVIMRIASMNALYVGGILQHRPGFQVRCEEKLKRAHEYDFLARSVWE